MAKWEYDLKDYGRALRAEIENNGEDVSSCIKTLEKLLECYKRIKELLPEDEYEWHFEDAVMMVEGNIDEFRYDDVLDAYAVETTNDSLAEFYDLCDDYRIWVGI